jgi:hypothetical protein
MENESSTFYKYTVTFWTHCISDVLVHLYVIEEKHKWKKKGKKL